MTFQPILTEDIVRTRHHPTPGSLGRELREQSTAASAHALQTLTLELPQASLQGEDFI